MSALRIKAERDERRIRGANADKIKYGEVKIDAGYRMDLVINKMIVVENKTVEKLLPIHQAQLLTYLKLSGYSLGFFLNWNVTIMKDGIKRIVNNL